MSKNLKVYAVEIQRRSRSNIVEGTIPELVKYFSYTLLVGESWQHEKGNKKINRNPKTIKSLVNNLNNAKRNAAANGAPDTYYYEA